MPDKFVVTTTNQGQTFWLRGTTWAFSRDRANVFETGALATAALDRARKFMTPAIYRQAVVVREEA